MTENGGSSRRVAGRYRLERRIGRGGAGAVWRAYDERLDRPVAVKHIRIAQDAPSNSRDRALREARAAARLRVPNVVQVYDVIEEDGSAYLIMELVDVPNLSTLVRRRGPLEPETVAAVGLQVLDALEAAHREGIVHRDVKPSNVLIDHNTARLTDFGIARLIDDPALTSTGVVMGTPAYIAPEHAQGKAIGPAIDLYGLGATLYYAVEGTSPFQADGSLSTVLAVVNSPPRPMVRAGALTDVLTELLAKDPNARPAAGEIRRRLEQVATGPALQRGRMTHAPWLDLDGGGDAADDDPTDETVRAGTDEDAAPAAADAAVTPEEVVTPEDAVTSGDVVTPDDAAGGDGAAIPEAGTRTVRQAAPDVHTAAEPLGGSWRAGRRSAMVAVALALALVAAIGLTWLRDGARDRTDQPAGAAAPVQPSESAAAPADTDDAGATRAPEDAQVEGQAGSDADAQTGSEPESDGDDGDGVLPPTDAEVPQDWVEFAPGDAPYRLRHPPGWDVVDVDETRTDIRDPDSGTYLRLDWVNARRDPIAAWEEAEGGFSARHAGYERIRLDPTDYKGNRAALWEYRYRDGGVGLRAYNLGVNAGEYGFALNLQSHASEWEQALELWPLFLSSYEFTGG